MWLRVVAIFSCLVVCCYGSTNCQRVRCPTPLCANPTVPPGECCPTCENSGCKFEGCVQFIEGPGDQDVIWKPSGGCIDCFCRDNQTLCGGVGCPIGPIFPPNVEPPDPCFGFPQTRKPWECCPVCNYSLPENQCIVVPAQRRNVTLTSLGQSCEASIVEHQCNKRGFLRRNGQRYRCRPVFRERTERLSQCFPFTRITYRDVIRCKAERNDNLDVGCDLFIE